MQKRNRFVKVILGALLAWTALASATSSQGSASDRRLSDLSTFNRTMLLLKEQYIDPPRIKPQEMLLQAIKAVEQRVPEVVISQPGGDWIKVQVGQKVKSFPSDGVTTLWDLSFRFRDMCRFIEQNWSGEVKAQQVEYDAVNGMLSKLDPHSTLFEPTSAGQLKMTTQGKFGGLGIVIGLRDGYLTVISPVDGSPADKAGIHSGDRIVKIGIESTINMPVDEAADKLRGPPQTPVMISILRKNSTVPKQLTLIRDIIKVDAIGFSMLAGGTGYIRVKSFHGNTVDEVENALNVLRGKDPSALKNLIVDLRNNPGGLMDQSVKLSDLFLDGGVIVATQGATPDRRDEELASRGPEKMKLPIAVLVNGGSASASEIVAGALKNRNRAIVIGQQTFGKGSVQMLYDFPDKSALKLTIAQYLTPGDESIQSVGITPDIELHPTFVSKKETLSLFAQARISEAGLSGHLKDKRTMARKPAYVVNYVAEELTPDEQEQRSLSSKFYDDYEIRFAKKLLQTVSGHTRQELVASSKSVVAVTQAEESENLRKVLKKWDLDWSAPKSKDGVPTKIQANLVLPAKTNRIWIKAGQSMQVTIEAKNTGKTDAFKLYGISKSATNLFVGREFLFGRLSPGMKKRWTVTMPVPQDALSRFDLMRVDIKDAEGRAYGSVNVPIGIQGAPHPRLAYSYFIDDAANKVGTGNGDGLPHAGETVDLVVWVKNIGEGVAKEPLILLKNLSGGDVFIDQGRQQLKALKPGDSAFTRLTFSVKKPVTVAELQLQVADAVMGDAWGEKVHLAVGAKHIPKLEGSQSVQIVSDTASLKNFPLATASVLAVLPKNTKLKKTWFNGDWCRVQAGSNLAGFLSCKTLKPLGQREKLSESMPDRWVRYFKMPPIVSFGKLSATPIMAKTNYRLNVSVQGKDRIKDAYIFANDQKVYYRAFNDISKKPIKFTTDIKLKPGVNVVTVVAREDETYGQHETLTIFSDVGDPILADVQKEL